LPFFRIKINAYAKVYFLCIAILGSIVLTAQSPALLKDIFNFKNNDGFGGNNMTVGSTTFFAASDGLTGTELSETDGTSAGTVLVKDINPEENSSSPANFININGKLFFTAACSTDSNTGQNTELWKSDGTEEGTVLVRLFIPAASPLTWGYLQM